MTSRCIRPLAFSIVIGITGCGDGPPPPPPPRILAITPTTVNPGGQVIVIGERLGPGGTLTTGAGRTLPVQGWTDAQVSFGPGADLEPGTHELYLDTGSTKLGPFQLVVNPPEPVIEGIEPARGKVGETVVLTGNNLGTGPPSGHLYFHGTEVTSIEEWRPDRIAFVAPPPGKERGVWVRIGEWSTPTLGFTLDRPVLKSASPSGALVGTEITLAGRHFASDGEVLFAGSALEVDVLAWDDTSIRLRLPLDLPLDTQLRVVNVNGASFPLEVSVLHPVPDGPLGPDPVEGKQAHMALDERDFPRIFLHDADKGALHDWRWSGRGWIRKRVTIQLDAGAQGDRNPERERSAELARGVKEIMDRHTRNKVGDPELLKNEIDEFVASREEQQSPIPPALVLAGGNFPRAAFDSRGVLHLTCFDFFHEKILYGRQEPGAPWVFRQLRPGPEKDLLFSDLVVDAGDRVHVAWMRELPGGVAYGVLGPGTLDVTPIDGTREVGIALSLAVGPDGRPHLAYLDFGKQGLRYATRSEEGAKAELIDDTGWTGDLPSIAVDAAGTPHIAYLERDEQGMIPAALRLATLDSGAWSLGTIEKGPGIGNQPCLLIDPRGPIHVLYLDQSLKAIKLATRVDGTWKIRVLSAEGVVADLEPGQLRAALGRDGTIRVLYLGGSPPGWRILNVR